MSDFDLLPFLGEIAARPRPPVGTPPLEAAWALNQAGTLMVFPLNLAVPLMLPGIVPVNDAEIANVTLIAHDGDAAATTALVEAAFLLGQRVALWDKTADIALIEALLKSIVYVGNLAAIDTDLARALAVVMTPLRSGEAFRRCTATAIMRLYVWNGVVRPEVERLYGAIIAPDDLPRALIQTRARMGAWLTRLGKRGLRSRLESASFRHGRVSEFEFRLKSI